MGYLPRPTASEHIAGRFTCSIGASRGEYSIHASCHVERCHQLRAGQHPDQAVQRRVPQERPLQPDRHPHRFPHPVPQGVGGRRRGGAQRADRQGLPALVGRVRAGGRRRAGALDPEASRSIDIEQFVDLDEIDPIYYDSAYYVAPDKAARKPYALLTRAMEEQNKVAIARFVMRSKQYLAALRPQGRRAGHVDDGLRRRGQRPGRARGEDVGDEDVSERELKMAIAARRVADRAVRARALRGHPPQPGARPDRPQGGRRGDRRRARRRWPRTRWSTSWPRSRPACATPRRPAPGTPRPRRPATTPRSTTRTSRRRPAPRREGVQGHEGDQGHQGVEGDEGDQGSAAPQVGLTAPRDRGLPMPGTTVEVEGRRLTLSNLDKVLYPETGTTKAEVIDYYARIAPAMVPHLADRGVTLRRFPDGVEGNSFFEKRCPGHRPDWLGTVLGPGDRNGRHPLLLPRLGTRAGVGGQHGGARDPRPHGAPDIETPTMCVFDLDPGRARRSSSVPTWRSTSATCSTASAWWASPRPRARRACRSTCR